MKVLGIDTATTNASIAIVDDQTVLAETRTDTAGHRADLLLLIDAACKSANVSPLDLDAIAIGAGPGSFTGLRIGMATAKGIAFAAGRPLWAVSSLAALAYARAGLVIAVLDARRGEVYAGAYRDNALVGVERLMPPSELPTFAASFNEPVTNVGDIYEPRETPTGAAVAKLALAGARVDVLVNGAPSYIRLSEAEIRYPDGVPGALRKR